MSALTDATIIVEASERSGTLVQANAVLEQGRKLFILDSYFRDSRLTCPERLAVRGAIRVVGYEDIRRHFVPEVEVARMPNRREIDHYALFGDRRARA